MILLIAFVMFAVLVCSWLMMPENATKSVSTASSRVEPNMAPSHA